MKEYKMIEISALKFRYSRKKVLFSDLDLSLASGHIVGLLGKNGEGKSTLLKLICSQLLRKGGEMRVLGADPKERAVSFLQQVYYLPEVIGIPKRCSIKNYLEAITPFYPNFDQQQLENTLDLFELSQSDRMDRLSMGQQKKVAIALALALNTPLLLMDEPTNGLDIPSKSLFRKLLAQQIDDDRLIIISTHQVRDLEQVTDQVVVMNQNKIIANYNIGELNDRLTCRLVAPGEEPIYAERTPAGMFGIFPQDEQVPSTEISLELFFNALLYNAPAMQRILNSSIEEGGER